MAWGQFVGTQSVAAIVNGALNAQLSFSALNKAAQLIVKDFNFYFALIDASASGNYYDITEFCFVELRRSLAAVTNSQSSDSILIGTRNPNFNPCEPVPWATVNGVFLANVFMPALRIPAAISVFPVSIYGQITFDYDLKS